MIVGPFLLHEIARRVIREVRGPEYAGAELPEKWDDLSEDQKAFFTKLAFQIYVAHQAVEK